MTAEKNLKKKKIILQNNQPLYCNLLLKLSMKINNSIEIQTKDLP